MERNIYSPDSKHQYRVVADVFRKRCIALFLGLCLFGVFPLGVSAQGFDAEEFSCRASALRVDLVEAEPLIANDQSVPCADDGAALLPPTTLDMGVVVAGGLLSTETEFGEGPGPGSVAIGTSFTADVQIINILELLDETLVEATVLHSQASVAATQAGSCELHSSSFVGSASVQGEPVEVDGNFVEIPLGPLGTLFLNHTETEDRNGDGIADKVTQRALFLQSELLGDVAVSEASADFENVTACDMGPPEDAADQKGFMTGGGRFADESGDRVTHGFRLECDTGDGPNRLQVNWGAGNSFHLEELTAAACTDDPESEPAPPAAAFDTYEGEGVGRLRVGDHRQMGTAKWTLTDAGEPGVGYDSAALTIRDENDNVVLQAPGNTLKGGNHQAHSVREKDNNEDN
ncbi:MAG: choice-of-anchor P family protein [Oleiphilaceae bacterium]|nr:choice-of-anchor P family protein [Oleiphilaceae bacterium]